MSETPADTATHRFQVVLTPAAEEGDDDFELIEKFGQGLKLDEHPPPYAQTSGTGDKAEKPAKSFFDAFVDLDKPTHDQQDRFAHLPALEIPPVLQAPANVPPFFPFSRTTVYLLLGPEMPQKKISSIVLHAHSDEGPLELKVRILTAVSLDTARRVSLGHSEFGTPRWPT